MEALSPSKMHISPLKWCKIPFNLDLECLLDTVIMHRVHSFMQDYLLPTQAAMTKERILKQTSFDIKCV